MDDYRINKFRGTSLDYDFDADPENGLEVLALVTSGCDCCSRKIPLTAENIQLAIKDAEEWLAYLRVLENGEAQRQGDL